MDFRTKYEILCTKGQLYPEDFIEKMGQESGHWDTDNWFQRETSLRHDMVCLLLCNTEPLIFRGLQDIDEVMEPATKRQRFDENLSDIISSSSSGSVKQVLKSSDFVDMGEDNLYRYILLEGRSNTIQIQNRLCSLYKIPVMSKQYDIFDRKEAKFCEVKVTLNKEKSVFEYQSYLDDEKYTCLIHLNPDTMEHYQIGKEDPFPGLGKAISFLIKRKTLMASIDVQESEVDPTEDMVCEIFKSCRFNKSKCEWVDTFWRLRNIPLLPVDKNPDIPVQVKPINQKELKDLIEDTTIRDASFMQYKGKLLPDQYTSCMLTTQETDCEILNDLFKDREFFDEKLTWVLNRWRQEQNTFKLVDGKVVKEMPVALRQDLGIQMKKTIRRDNDENLIQPEFQEPEKKRYANWMSNLIKDFAIKEENELNFFVELNEEEFPSDHPIAKISQQIVNKVFSEFSSSILASFCSKVKNFYSRIGGAYLKRGGKSDKRPAVVIFPLYASGHKDGTPVRKVTGFILRGPQHAKKSTDRIPFITVEMLGITERSRNYQLFIKKMTVIEDSLGTKWCYRVNSVQKDDPSYLTFIIDSIYLTTNMIGEMTFANTNLNNIRITEVAFALIEDCREWLLERMAESVLMAVLGNSQEEGLLAGLRKVFMLKLNWHRGEIAWGSDIKGFADSINECLIDQPLALYFAKHFRDILE